MITSTLSDHIERYLNDAGTGCHSTRLTYRTSMNRFRVYLTQRQRVPEQETADCLDVDLLLGFATWLLETRQIGLRTLHTYLAGLIGLVQYMQLRGALPWSPQDLGRFHDGMQRIRRNQRPPDLMPHPVRQEELNALVEAARNAQLPDNGSERDHLTKLRDVAMLETLACTGLRVSELVGLRRKQLDAGDCSSWVVGKRGKARQVFYSENAWHAVHHYLQARLEMDTAARQSLGDIPVFARHDRRVGEQILPIQTGSVQNVIRSLAERAALSDQGITPHALRHYFATRMYQTTRDLAVTQTALGHSSPATTRIYAKLEDDAVLNAHRAAFE